MNIAKILGFVSALALMVAVTAYTEAHATAVQTTGEMSNKESPILNGIQKDMQQNWNQVKADFKSAQSDTRSSVEQNNYQARILDDANAGANIMYSGRTTATGMIGQQITDTNGKKIATLKDIILDSTGKAVLAVVSDGGFMGVGDKLAALDYSLIVQQNADGDMMMPVDKATLKKVAPFSYNTAEASDKINVIPNNGYSVAQLLRGKILDPQSNALGNVENITFRGGEAAQVIVSFDQKLGLGGDRAALDFDNLTIARQANGMADFRMNEHQSAQFETYKSIKPN